MQLSSLNSDLPFVTGYAQQEYWAAEMGILSAKKENCDYWYIDGSLESEMPIYWNPPRINSLLKKINQYQIKPIFHGNFKSPLASDVEEIRKAAVAYTKQEIDIAYALCAPIILHGGAIVEPRLIKKAKQKALQNYLHSLHELYDYAQRYHVDLYLENLCNYKYYRPFHYMFTQSEEIEYILKNTQNIYLFLDIGHANVCDGNPVDLISQFHQKIIGMSFSNNDGTRDQHLGLFKGTIDYVEIVKTIIQFKWKGIIGFETRGKTTTQSINELRSIYQSSLTVGEAL